MPRRRARACRRPPPSSASSSDVTDRPPRLPIIIPAVVSAVVVAWGNGLVVASRAIDGSGGEVLTLVAQPLAGAALVLGCRLGGFTWRELGLVAPVRRDPDHRRWLRRFDRGLWTLLWLVAALVLVDLVVGFGRGGDLPLTIVRIVVGTAIGEELLHRSALLALWSDAAGAGAALVANIVTFGAFHIAAANKSTGFRWGEVLGPAVLAVPLCIARWRTRSVASPMFGHAGFNGLTVFG